MFERQQGACATKDLRCHVVNLGRFISIGDVELENFETGPDLWSGSKLPTNQHGVEMPSHCGNTWESLFKSLSCSSLHCILGRASQSHSCLTLEDSQKHQPAACKPRNGSNHGEGLTSIHKIFGQAKVHQFQVSLRIQHHILLGIIVHGRKQGESCNRKRKTKPRLTIGEAPN